MNLQGFSSSSLDGLSNQNSGQSQQNQQNLDFELDDVTCNYYDYSLVTSNL